jgi:hypothetical protein
MFKVKKKKPARKRKKFKQKTVKIEVIFNVRILREKFKKL